MRKLFIALLIAVSILTMAAGPISDNAGPITTSAETAEYKFEVGDQVLWGGWSCVISYAGPMTNLDGTTFLSYTLQQASGPLEFAVRAKNYVESTAVLEKAVGSTKSVAYTKDGEWPPRCDPMPPPCIIP